MESGYLDKKLERNWPTRFKSMIILKVIYSCSCIEKAVPPPSSAPVSPIPSAIQTLTLEEIWSTLENMADYPNIHLTEQEFLVRFKMLAQVCLDF